MKEIPEAKSLRWLANMFPITKNPKDEIALYNLQHAYDIANELNYLIYQNDAVDIVVDYAEGIDRTTGNNKIYVK